MVNCLRRPFNKQTQSSKLYTSIDNFVRIEEENIVDDKLQIDKDGESSSKYGILILRCFSLLKNVKIGTYTFIV